MEKEVAKIFKKYGNDKIVIRKKYRAKSFEKGQKTTAVEGTRLALNETLANILLKGKREEQKLVSVALRNTYREDWEDGKVIKY